MTTTTGLPRVTGFRGRHMLSIAHHHRRDIEDLFLAADAIRTLQVRDMIDRPLAGRVLVSAFFDASTRTRLAHEAAMVRLGGSTTGFSDIEETRAGSATGESLSDVYKMLDFYGDVIVTRHTEEGAADLASRIAGTALVINAGDGKGEHPTQALTDLYSIWRRLGHIDGTTIGIVNDLRMRCVKSLLRGLRCFDCRVRVVGADGMELPPELVDECRRLGPEVSVRNDLREMLPEVDVVYSSPTIMDKSWRIESDDDVLRGDTPLTRDLVYRWAKPSLGIFHPLPRTVELATDLDDTTYNAYWDQARNSVPLRMALLLSMLA